MLQCDPPCHNRLLQLLGHHGCSWGAEGWSAARQRAREAEGDGGRGAGGPHVACADSKAGGAGGKKRRARAIRTETQSGGRSFLGAASSDAETDCSHGCPDAGVRPNVQALVVLIAYWAQSLRRARNRASDAHARMDALIIALPQIKSREENGCPEDQIKSTEENICLFFPLLLILILPNIIP
jgi:hypothetical protein